MNIVEQINQSDEFAIGCLIALYNRQTEDEQSAKTTAHLNGIGFNSIDSNILSSISQQYLDKGSLSIKQIAFVKRAIVKYKGQLESSVIEPLPLKQQEKKEQEIVSPMKRAEPGENNKIILRFRFPKGDNRFYETLNFVKSLRFRKFDSKNLFWSVPFSVESAEALLKNNWDIHEDIRDRYRQATDIIKPEDDIFIPGLCGRPYPFQKQGINFIDKAGGNAIIADEMGLGKTIQALGWLQLHPEARPAINVCPATLKDNWYREAKKWLSKDQKIVVLSGRPNEETRVPNADIYIVNYDIISNVTKKVTENGKTEKKEIRNTGWADWFLNNLDFKVVIADECHKIKNNKTLWTQAFKRLCKRATNVIGLSGTPVENKPSEFFNILSIVKPDIFNDWVKYSTEYCGAYRGRYGWEYDKENQNGKALHDLLVKNVMIRRLKKNVLKDLPEKRRNVVVLPMTKEGSKAYKEIEKIILTYDPNSDPKIALAEIERAKQQAVVAKLEAAVEWVNNFIEDGNKLVLFMEHKNVADYFEKAFKNICVRVTGQSKNRQAAVDSFQNDDKIRLFIGSKAAKEGLTLTAAADTAFLELWWAPSWHDQAEDRVHRIGQESQSINAWYLLAADTCEEDLAELLDEKRKITTAVLDGEEVNQESMIKELLIKMKEKLQ